MLKYYLTNGHGWHPKVDKKSQWSTSRIRLSLVQMETKVARRLSLKEQLDLVVSYPVVHFHHLGHAAARPCDALFSFVIGAFDVLIGQGLVFLHHIDVLSGVHVLFGPPLGVSGLEVGLS